MRVELVVIMDDGSVLRGAANLSTAANRQGTRKAEPASTVKGSDPDFTLPARAFMKKYAADLSGPKKLTLLVACLAKGDSDTSVARADVERAWAKMKGLLGGGYNPAYDTRARDNGWISSPKAGTFQLREGWNAIAS